MTSGAKQQIHGKPYKTKGFIMTTGHNKILIKQSVFITTTGPEQQMHGKPYKTKAFIMTTGHNKNIIKPRLLL